ncbi:MAG: hypothetical protein ABFC38_15135 [Methanospirillum sp.]
MTQSNGGGTTAPITGSRPAVSTEEYTRRHGPPYSAGDVGPGAVRAALDLLLEPGAVAELRAIGRDGRVASGYFDDPALLAEKAEALDASGDYSGVYVTLNPVHPALLARRANRVEARLGRKDATTADADVLRRRWLPIDIDPVRASGISATAGERENALSVAARIREFLDGLGWPAPIVADSGNGAHLLYRGDLPNDDESTALVKAVLAALDARFSTERAKVDCANFNAGRIWKVYGTVSRKGDSTADRPHRRAAVLEAPRSPAPVPALLLGSLAATIASVPPEPTPAACPAGPNPGAAGAADEVLERGDPVGFLLAAFARDHVGDETLAHCLIMSIASQAVLNSRGLHVYVTGESGKGKSSGMTAMLRQVPEEYRLAERMSDKALYYSDDIGPGTVLLLDDIALSEELQEVLKEATSKFTEPIRMRTVDTDRKVRHCLVPERCVWWLANVRALYDDQVLNRMLTCWVDDSKAQDGVVFERQLAEEARPAREAVNGRFDLAVCRELWRAARSGGLVYVEVPFATRIRMASVSNRRNTLVLLDLVRSHALLHLRQRSTERLEDGTLVVTATRADFDYAAGLFSALHAGGGSLGSKFDRNEDLVLALALKKGIERFTIRDVQKWTGWTYQKARRTMLGYFGRGVRYPGLLDKSPALSLIDQTAVDPEEVNRDVRQRQNVFVFDPEVYREALVRGEAWLKDEAPAGCTPVEQGDEGSVEHSVGYPSGGRCGENSTIGGSPDGTGRGAFITPDRTVSAGALPLARSAPAPVEQVRINPEETCSNMGSDDDSATRGCSTTCSTGYSTGVQHAECCHLPSQRAFVALESPAPVPCDTCGRRPSHYRERRPAGEPRHLCRACHAAAVRREQRAGPPLPGVIDPGGLRRVRASVGRCDVCDLEAAAWSGGGVRLCEACYDREARRRVREGAVGPADV